MARLEVNDMVGANKRCKPSLILVPLVFCPAALVLGRTPEAGAAKPAAVRRDLNECALRLKRPGRRTQITFAWRMVRRFLRNEANTAWLGGRAPGSVKTIETALAHLSCDGSKVERKGARERSCAATGCAGVGDPDQP